MKKVEDEINGLVKSGIIELVDELIEWCAPMVVVCLFVCGISLTSGQLFNELFPDCTRSCFSQVLRHIYEMRCLFVAVGPMPAL